jgi:hypothetical protein
MKFVKFTGRQHLSTFSYEYQIPESEISMIRKYSKNTIEIFNRNKEMYTCSEYKVEELKNEE